MRVDGGVLESRGATTDISRRRLLMLAGSTTAALAWSGGLGRSLPGAGAAMRNPLRRSRFTPYLGQQFRLTGPGRAAVSARLERIYDIGPKSAAGSEDAFAVLFHGPKTPRLASQVVRVSHPTFGHLDLLVSPAGTGRRGQDYAAVINRTAPRT